MLNQRNTIFWKNYNFLVGIFSLPVEYWGRVWKRIRIFMEAINASTIRSWIIILNDKKWCILYNCYENSPCLKCLCMWTMSTPFQSCFCSEYWRLYGRRHCQNALFFLQPISKWSVSFGTCFCKSWTFLHKYWCCKSVSFGRH